MAEVTTIMKGQLQDHLGRVLHPDSEADQISTKDGKSVDTKLEELLAKFAEYLPKNGGGDITGNVNINLGRMSISNWGSISSGTDGHVMYAQNAYKNPVDNKYYYLQTHSNMGARGIVFRHGAPGIYWFDMGLIATTADAEFTPTFIRLDKPEAEIISNQDLDTITVNGAYCGTNMSNAPGGSLDWFYINVLHLNDNSIAYVSQIARWVNGTSMYVRSRINGTWSAWKEIITENGGNITGDLTIRGQKVPAYYASTSAPTPSDGQDGDVWDVYV